MIYNTQTFWSYLVNENPYIVNQVIELLTRKDYDFDTKETKISTYYQIVSKNQLQTVIRFPSGLIKYITNKLPIQVETAEQYTKQYTEDDIRGAALLVKLQNNPNFEVRDYQIEAVLASLDKFTSLIQSTTGSGKAQSIYTKIPTPNGVKLLGTLKIGDEIFGSDGKLQKIIGIFPQGKKDIYKISFANGTFTNSTLDHLWQVYYRRSKHSQTKPLKDILPNYIQKLDNNRKSFEYSIDYTQPIEYPEKNYFIDPYVLGVLIGDGTLTTKNIGFSCPDLDSDIAKLVASKLNSSYHLYKNSYPNCPQYYIKLNQNICHKKQNEYYIEIKKLNLDKQSHEKFIPKQYLEGSIEQRKALLAGLLDTDGHCQKRNKKSSTTITTVSLKLAKDIQQLVWSLGGRATFRQITRPGKHTEYTIQIQLLFNPFKLTRKGNNFCSFLERNSIINIEKLQENVECVCIKVSNTDELYITENFVVTHNTTIMSLVCKVLADKQILITNGNNFILQQIYERLQSFGITDVSWNQGKEPDYTQRIVLLNSSSSDSRLNRNDEAYINFLKKVQVWIIDEAAHFQSITNFEPIFYMDSEKLEHIIGYTATPFRNYKFPYDDPADFTLIALLGEPAFIYEMKDTINDENIAKPYSYFINFRNREAFLPPHLKDNYFMQYRANITYNKSRNAAGKAMVKYLNQHGIKTLVSFNNIKPAQKLMKELKEDGVNALFICGNETIYEWIPDKRGKLKLDTRRGTAQDIEIALETGGYNICFASQVFDEGVDINIFQAAILFSAGKSPIKVLQVAGRAARKKKENNVCFIIDFKDVDGCYIFRSQYEQRKELMKASGIINIDKVENFCKMIEEISHSRS